MNVDLEKCLGCGSCVPYCPMRALSIVEDQLSINHDECVECNICYRANVCPTEALLITELTWPRIVRNVFSDPLMSHDTTGVPGRGTEEMKTNDVTNRFVEGHLGIAIEMGRPGTGTRFYDVEKVAQAVAKFGVKFEVLNPVTSLMTDTVTGKIKEDVLNEKVLSAIIEFDIEEEKGPQVLQAIKEVSSQIETVFSLDVCAKVPSDNSLPSEKAAYTSGITPSINGKTNVGLGRV
ncbi:4Fe-4S binding protein [Desulfotomaculum nigrificans]|uniref:4Fe-4S binding protein n=1 Tax=Desulfotomaculum nigrificans TaxID=1565 RepID=UPI0001FAE711|nr:4Fe-4S binding protein [Desulfotomaculum nigrificans]